LKKRKDKIEPESGKNKEMGNTWFSKKGEPEIRKLWLARAAPGT